MKKKLIILILVLPLFLMVSLFTATRTVSLAVKVPVTGVKIISDPIVYLDLDEEETYDVAYTVYPTNAENQEIFFSTEAVEGFDLAELEFKNGRILPKTVGRAKAFITTVDGGYRDSCIVQVDSDTLQSIECSAEKTSLLVGETTAITTSFKPANAGNLLLDYVSSNPSVAKVNAKGEITAMGRGTAIVTVSSKANPAVKDTVEIHVYQNAPLVFAQPSVITWNHTGSLQISVQENLDYEYSVKAYGEDLNELSDEVFTASFDLSKKAEGHIVLQYAYLQEDYLGKITVEVFASYDGTLVSEVCEITFVNEIELAFDAPTFEYFAGQNVTATFSLAPDGAEVTYSYETSNNNVQVVLADDGIVALYAGKAGVTTLTLRATDKASGRYKEATAEIIVKPKSLIITESASTFGDENLLAVGGTEFDGSANKTAIRLSYKASEIGEGFLENLSFETNEEKVTIGKDGVLKIDGSFTGEIKAYGVFAYGDVEYKTSPLRVYCVGNGVNVRSFKELYRTVEAGKPVVLQTDVVEDFGFIDGNAYYSENTVGKMHTTYDDTYYRNIGKQADAQVKVLLAFKNDVYGNGFTINAGNVTMQLDEAGALKNDALFRGPLNFVSMTESAVSAVSVKAQDNICFALHENVNVRNVKLYGCTLQADEQGHYDMTDLDYVGTTVEALGDNVNVAYSRIHNGRTVFRAFGDAEDSLKVIRVNISNSVLGGAREFILRMGSNAFVDCPPAEDVNAFQASRLPGDAGINFPAQKAYANQSQTEKQTYDAQFIKTFVNVKNSVFTDAGIFAIGIDSHFSGVYLAQGRDIFQGNSAYATFVEKWYDLAKTSYGAKLTFEGEVRMYSWKELDTVDSSTLIEIVGESSFAAQLEFNVKDMVQGIANNENFKNIVYNKDGKQYVHAGIAFFGGGKNYGVFEFKNAEQTQFEQLVGYEIGLDEVDKGFLASAAGKEKFYFLLHDATTQFLPQAQETLLQSKNAYDCIYK